MELPILYQDDYIVAVNKPHGLLVHRSRIANDVEISAIQILEKQLGRKVRPAHRLDRKTSGVLLFSFDEKTDRELQKQFMERSVDKTYLALVRGFAPQNLTIDYPLKREDGKIQEAVTHLKSLTFIEVPVPFGKFPTSRYSLVQLHPETGRMHQLRKHMAHIFHPIIGDRPHGCNKQNRFFKENWQLTSMLLHASQLTFQHPVSNQKLVISAAISDEFNRILKTFGAEEPVVVSE